MSKEEYCKGITKKTLSFYKKRKCWYAEVPEHSEGQNLMVSGADVMCEVMAQGHKRVTAEFLYSDESLKGILEGDKKPYVVLEKIDQSRFGATYKIEFERCDEVVLPQTAWLCNVTKTVCGGSHPNHIAVIGIEPNDKAPYEGKKPW